MKKPKRKRTSALTTKEQIAIVEQGDRFWGTVVLPDGSSTGPKIMYKYAGCIWLPEGKKLYQVRKDHRLVVEPWVKPNA